MEILFPFQNFDRIMFYQTLLFECTFLMLKLSANYPPPFCSDSWLKSQTDGIWTFQFFLFWLKLCFPTFSYLNVIFNNKISGTKHFHLWNAAQLTSQNIDFFSPDYFVFFIKIIFPFQNLAIFILFTNWVLLTLLVLAKFQVDFHIQNL